MIFLKTERIRAKFLGKKGTELVDMLKEPYEENARSIYKWTKWFQTGREDVKDDDACEARPSTLHTDENIVRKFVLSNRRITGRMIAEKLSSR